MDHFESPNPSRRKFLQTSLATVAGFKLAHSGFSHAAEPASTLLVDTHTHFYDPTRPGGVPWPGPGDKVLYRPVLPAEFRTLTKPHGPMGTILVEASPLLEDNQWVLDLADREAQTILGVVGNLDPLQPDFPAHVRRFRKHPHYRGFRLGHQKLKAGLPQAEFIARLKLVVDANWSLDLNGGPDLLLDVIRLAEKLPELRIVINHLANVRIDGQAPPASWSEPLKRCGEFQQVWCKVSALVEGARQPDDTAPAALEYYRPVLDTAWNAFGADRLIYGSNWPVSARYAPYSQVFQIADDYFTAKGSEVREKFFWKNAQTAYQWPGQRS